MTNKKRPETIRSLRHQLDELNKERDRDRDSLARLREFALFVLDPPDVSYLDQFELYELAKKLGLCGYRTVYEPCEPDASRCLCSHFRFPQPCPRDTRVLDPESDLEPDPMP